MIQSFELRSLSIFKKIVIDYVNENDSVKDLISDFPSFRTIEAAIETKYLSSEHRRVVSHSLRAQYDGITVAESVTNNIHLLADSRTFTVTTGHQLNLFTGPLYFLIKIAQTIGLANDLKKKFPGYNFVPIYWMATEDHDLEEIDHFHLFNKKRQWNTDQTGATGRMNTEGIEALGTEIESLFERDESIKEVVTTIKSIYSKNSSLAAAARELVHYLFPEDGVVVLDADDHTLKSLFKEELKRELIEGPIYTSLNETNTLLENRSFHTQLTPREINIFYLKDTERVRLEHKENQWQTIDGVHVWSREELESEVDQFPERFSPNAAFRPVYQEFLLPNLVMIGGPGEVAYWLQLKSVFKLFKVDFPFLILRNSHAFLTLKQQKVMEDFNLTFDQLLQRKEDLIKMVSGELLSISIENQKEGMQTYFSEIQKLVASVDPTLEGKVNSASKNLFKELSSLESKLEKSVRQKEAQKFKQLERLLDSVYPDQVLGERKLNFLNFLNSINYSSLMSALKSTDDTFVPKLFVHTIQ